MNPTSEMPAHIPMTKAVRNICANMGDPMTKRDEIWDVALTLAAAGGKSTTAEVERATAEAVSRRTILDCLASMETAGWLAMRDRGPHGIEFWLAGSVRVEDGRDDVVRPSGVIAMESEYDADSGGASECENRTGDRR